MSHTRNLRLLHTSLWLSRPSSTVHEFPLCHDYRGCRESPVKVHEVIDNQNQQRPRPGQSRRRHLENIHSSVLVTQQTPDQSEPSEKKIVFRGKCFPETSWRIPRVWQVVDSPCDPNLNNTGLGRMNFRDPTEYLKHTVVLEIRRVFPLCLFPSWSFVTW